MSIWQSGEAMSKGVLPWKSVREVSTSGQAHRTSTQRWSEERGRGEGEERGGEGEWGEEGERRSRMIWGDSRRLNKDEEIGRGRQEEKEGEKEQNSEDYTLPTTLH